MKYGVLIGFLILGIIMVSGCSNKAPKNPQEDIILTQSLESTAKAPGEWQVNQTIKSFTGTGYSKIKIRITAYDSNNQTLDVKETMINDMPPSTLGSFSVVIQSASKPDHIGFQILNATEYL
jgi:hypothetical protein